MLCWWVFSSLLGLSEKICYLGLSSIQSRSFRMFICQRRSRFGSVSYTSFQTGRAVPPGTPLLLLPPVPWVHGTSALLSPSWQPQRYCWPGLSCFHWTMSSLRSGLRFPPEGRCPQLPRSTPIPALCAIPWFSLLHLRA